MHSRRKLLFGVVAGMLILSLISGCWYVYNTKIRPLENVWKVMNLIRTHSVQDISLNDLVAGAIDGMVKTLNDPHSVYMDAKTLEEFNVQTQGNFEGIGVVVEMKDGHLTVVAPMEGSPGEQAGVRSGDYIVQIDGQSTAGMSADEAVSHIRGPEGTTVTLGIQRDGDPQVLQFTITRAKILIHTVQGKMLDDKIAYIRITMFNENTGKDFLNTYHDLEKQGMKALVLDLRDNPGGLLNECVEVAKRLVPQGPIVSIVSRSGKQETYNAPGDGAKYPLAVLVNGGSASAAEIVAGAVQDTKAGILVGTKTFGKGSVQTIYPLSGGAGLKLTIAKYLTPNDRAIDGIGIEPDVVVAPAQGEDEKALAARQLEKAVALLKAKL